MGFDDRDWDRHRPSFDRPRDMLMWKIAGGVAIGIIVAALLIGAVERYRMQVAIDEGMRMFKGLTSGVSESAARSAQEARQRESQRAAAEQQARERKAQQQRNTQEAKRAAIEEAARKERAWAKFYKRPPHCDNNPNDQQMVDCANEHIRAKRRFEEAKAFIQKWGAGGQSHALTERAGAQPHFIDLCRVLGVPEPDDPHRYCFERGITKTGSAAGRTDGFADVWLKGHFAWEYKAPGKSLEGALR
jgi:hypothetical protein